MAEAIGLVASIIGIASAGISVVTALTKFSISYKESDNKIQELAARVSLTATILQAIGDTVKENEAGFKKEAFMVTWKEVLDACDATYSKLDAAILKAKGKETEKGKSKKKSSTWGKLKWALGGEAVMKELEASLEKSSQQVMMMQQVIQLTAIKLIGKSRQVPQQAEIDEKKELMSKMDWTLTGLMKSGLISHNQELGSPAFMEREIQESGNNSSKQYSRELAIPTYLSTNVENAISNTPGLEHQDRNPQLIITEPRLVSARKTETLVVVPRGSSAMASSANKHQHPGFEAYFIAPHSISRDLPERIFRLMSENSDEYITISLDTCLQLSTIETAMLHAESSGRPSEAAIERMQIELSKLPEGAQREIRRVLDLRNRNSKLINQSWTLVELVMMLYVPPAHGQFDGKSIPQGPNGPIQGYIIILRGAVPLRIGIRSWKPPFDQGLSLDTQPLMVSKTTQTQTQSEALVPERLSTSSDVSASEPCLSLHVSARMADTEDWRASSEGERSGQTRERHTIRRLSTWRRQARPQAQLRFLKEYRNKFLDALKERSSPRVRIVVRAEEKDEDNVSLKQREKLLDNFLATFAKL